MSSQWCRGSDAWRRLVCHMNRPSLAAVLPALVRVAGEGERQRLSVCLPLKNPAASAFEFPHPRRRYAAVESALLGGGGGAESDRLNSCQLLLVAAMVLRHEAPLHDEVLVVETLRTY